MKILKLAFLPVTTLLIFLYLYGAIQHSNLINIRTRTGDLDHGDQGAYIEVIKKTYNESFRFLGDRNRMPLYTTFQAIFYTPGITDERLFAQAKLINIFFSIFLIYLMFIFNRRYISKLSNIVFTLIIGFSVFLPRSAYVQPELLYFTLSFFAFVYFCKTIKHKKVADVVFAAILAVAAYMTKASMLLGFGFFIFFLFLSGLKGYRIKRMLAIPIIALIIFLSLVSPYLIQTKKLYGGYFFNYATTYMWSQNWDEALTVDKKLRNIEYIRSLSKDQLPSLGRYIKERSASDMSLRMFTGIILNIGILLGTYATLSSAILILYILFLIYFIFSSIRLDSFRRFLNQNKAVIIFILGYLLSYFFAFSWYAPIGAGPRFTFTTYIPALFSVLYLSEKLSIKGEVSKFNPISTQLFYLTHIASFIILFLGVKGLIFPYLFTSWAGF
ncbi:hypothetical protein A2962_01370 [Candidatus Woesebacteria bacterium RIFCSPLOWO2_01_FULL_39_61]|uniref:Glycosyltransferase RgtA/B/C/D-like domain-containing protein n=1 Tax=Candidatus Woesebacteria bacterium RIFCSPHIGHO2_02_FULL_39_13 TaxID=1802505 RepID=A0A1F7Z5U5_9BACT|nr:MAG: hypothetical protein A2692_01610 [Candidatus Woesebacteria bacterium RIFCSPHIGHO2_01_FULL_39_95]OGM34499.1 MAG: hypothetical protein A3D01_03065 [Candidatus Woesebacteria bacterium RIFCSPHIGHO2_02_FULL_39_13]OGM38766.1 MAG: hypothetical protein A3E13_00955 [Candidatus Woesebacteria bacterium RIFCSPHIGHO2_12_FULL_40_20]OGM65772.1 MAG: hypothetical protein A2962_01370 [Candidatus Woesebacteria bacterium RIFCSPLOWO2_01_FULL_39_61]OGM72025.1 MAG: hypothetical protein A3H19_04230 [Candidatus